jgi:hypothetical protein
MKRIILLVFSICAGALYAQDSSGEISASADTITAQLPINYGNRIQKGTVLIKGSIGFSTIESRYDRNDLFTISVGGMLAVSDRFAVGLSGGVNSSKNIYESSYNGDRTEVKFNSYFVAAQFRYFGKTYWGWLQPFGVLSGSFSEGKVVDIDQQEATTESIRVGIRPGLMVFLSRRFALETSIGFLTYERLSPLRSEGVRTSFYAQFYPSDLHFGLIYLINAR